MRERLHVHSELGSLESKRWDRKARLTLSWKIDIRIHNEGVDRFRSQKRISSPLSYMYIYMFSNDKYLASLCGWSHLRVFEYLFSTSPGLPYLTFA